MRQKFIFKLLLSLWLSAFVGVGLINGQTTIWTEDFSTSDNYSVTQGAEGSDGTSDYFFRTDGSDIGPSYTGNTDFFFAGQDIDDTGWTGSASPSQLTWTGIDISGVSGNIEFSGLFASTATDKIDDNDYILVEYQVDGGGWSNLIAFENDGATYNTFFMEDTDFDGTGDGTQLTSTFQEFTKTIAESGTSMDIRVTAAVNSGGEDFAIEDFTISDVPPPNPADWCNLQSPPNGTIAYGGEFNVYAQVWEDGITNDAGQGAGIDAWIGVSMTDTDPSTWTTWIPANYNVDVGNNDEYMADIGSNLPSAGTYYYASRFQVDGGPYTYGGYSGTDGGFWDGTTNVSGVLTVNAPTMEITSTHAGETYYGGDNVVVNWTSTGVTTVDLQVWVPADAQWVTIETGLTAADGTVTTVVSTDADYGTEYMLRLKDADADSYSIPTGNFTIIPVASVKEIQSNADVDGNSNYVGSIVKTGGIVSAVKSPDNYFIQAGEGAWSGIAVEQTGHGLSIGDSIVFDAEVAESYNMTQLTNPTNITTLASQTPWPAGIVATGNIDESWECVLVTVENAEVIDNTLGFEEFSVSDGSGDCRVDDGIYSYTLPDNGRVFGSITGPVEFSFSNFKILPRDANDMVMLGNDATLATFTLGGQDVTGLTGLEVADPVADEGATLYVDDFTGFAGIVIDATDAAATVEVKLNDVVVDPADYATQALADGDVVVATVTAEDGSMAYYKVNITGENRELTLTGPALPTTFSTGDDITFTWTSANIANVNIYAVDATKAVNQINETPIDASLGTWTYTVENGDFGVFTIRITDASDETFLNETTEQATINDVQAPERTAESPLNGATGQPLSMTLTLTFDEDIAVGIGNITVHNAADDAQVATLNVADGIISANELSIDVSGLSYNTDYYVLYDGGIVQDIAGNDAWALTDKTAWTFKTSQEPTGDLFFSEYIEGSSNNKALEIYNGTGADIDLSAYIIRINSNGGEWTSHFELPDGKMLANGDVYVIAHADAEASILSEADTAVVNPYTGGESYVAVFNGDDVRALCKVAGTDTTIIDIIGRYDQVDPGSGWEVAGIADATGEHTLVRKNSVTEGNTDWDASAGTNADDSEWIVYGQDEFSYIGMHGSTEPALTITSPEDGSTLYTTTVNVTFDVQNFTVGDNAGGTDDGYVVYTLDSGTETDLFTTDAFDLSDLSLGEHTLEMWLVDNNGVSLDPSVTYSVTFTIDEVQALSIYDIQYTTAEGDGTYPSLEAGSSVSTSGIVTAVDAGSAYFIQDGTGAWNGIYVYDTNAVSEGDEIALTGEVAEFYGLTQLTNISSFEIVSSGNTLPEATIVSTADANMEDYESVLVRVESAECTDADIENNFGMWTVNDGSGALLIDDDLFAFTPTATTNYNVTGVGFYSYDNSKILPRSAEDIEEAVSVGEITATAVKLYPNPANDVLFISSDSDVSRVEVYNLLGQNVMSTNIDSKQTELNISDLDAGMYIIKVYGENAAQTHRFIKN